MSLPPTKGELIDERSESGHGNEDGSASGDAFWRVEFYLDFTDLGSFYFKRSQRKFVRYIIIYLYFLKSIHTMYL